MDETHETLLRQIVERLDEISSKLDRLPGPSEGPEHRTEAELELVRELMERIAPRSRSR